MDGESAGSEYLMGSGGVYRSAQQRRLFHLVIQLFSHLVDVVSPCEGSGRTHTATRSRQHQSYGSVERERSGTGGCGLENWEAFIGLDVLLYTGHPKSLQFRGCHIFLSSPPHSHAIGKRARN